MIRFPLYTDYLKRTTNLAPANGDYTCVFWVYLETVAVGSEYRTLYLINNSIATYTQWVGIFSGVGDNNFYLDAHNGTSGASTASFEIKVNRFVPIAYVREGTIHRLYIDGALRDSFTLDISAATFSEQYLSDTTFSDNVAQLKMFGFKEWEQALTLAELIIEWNLATVTETTDLLASTPLETNANDNSGNGNNWTVGGSPTFSDSPIQLPLTNAGNSAGPNAHAIDLDEEYVQVARSALGVTTSLWFKYTGAVAELIYAIWARATNDVYLPRVNAYSDESGSTVWNNIFNFAARPIEIPLVPTEMTVWMRVTTNAGNPIAVINFRTASFTQQAAPIGSLLIPDDVGQILAIISATDGEVLQLRPSFPAAQNNQGHSLKSDGNMIFNDALDGGDYKIFNNQLVELATIPVPSGTEASAASDDQFLVSGTSGGNTNLDIYSNTGTLQTSQSLTGVNVGFMTPNDIADTLYFAEGGINKPIKRWSISGNTFLSDLVGGVANYRIQRLLWLSDNTLLAAYVKTSPVDVFVIRYDCATAAILNTYSTQFDDAFISSVDFLAWNIDDPVSFWAWIVMSGGNSRFMKIQTSDGTILIQFDKPNFSGGSNNNPNSDEMFGHNQTCPFTILTEEIPPPGDATTGTLIITKITVPANTDEFDINTTGPGGFDEDTTLQNGQTTTYTELTPGEYSVIEDAVAGYTTEYDVSNGDPNDAIEIVAGETVTVTITNSSSGSITVQKVTNGSVSAIKFLFTLSGDGIPTSTVELANGEEHTFENIPAGVFQISEDDLAPGWQIYSVVINGSDGSLDEVTVEAGVETLVIVTNQFIPAEGSGLYFIDPTRRHDTIWRPNEQKEEKKIPDPFYKTALLGE